MVIPMTNRPIKMEGLAVESPDGRASFCQTKENHFRAKFQRLVKPFRKRIPTYELKLRLLTNI